MNPRPQWLVWLILGSCAFFLTQAVLSLLLSPGDSPAEGNPIWRLILMVCYAGVAALLIPYRGEAFFVARRNLPLIGLVLLALVSCFWADVPDLVLRRSVAVLGTTLLGIGLAVRLPLIDQLRLLVWVFRVIAALSLLCVVFFPQYGITGGTEGLGEWRGIFSHKNRLGTAMAISILAECHLPADGRFEKWLKKFSLLTSAVLLLFANSLTPTLSLLGALLCIAVYRFSARRLRLPLYAIVTTTFGIVAACVLAIVANADTVTGVLGRSSNLTGRSEIWGLVVSFAWQHPFLGYGYSGFWAGASPDSIAINQDMGTPIMYSHNGYLELLLTLGVVGLFFALAFLAAGLRRALRYSEFHESVASLWPLAFLFYFLLHNLAECTILYQDLEWSICVAAIVAVDPALILLGAAERENPILSPAEQPA